MKLHFTQELRGTAQLPSSKSISNRALFINAVQEKPCLIEGLAQCDDTEAMMRVVRGETAHDVDAPTSAQTSRSTRKRKANTAEGMASLFGDSIDTIKEDKTVASAKRIDVGAAGTAMRFGAALLSLREGKQFLLSGSDRMHQRPIGILVNALRSLGADISYHGKEGFPPLLIKGKKLTGTTIELTADISSQYVSALLMIGPLLPQGLQLKLQGEILSRPYINLTLGVMRQFGAHATWVGENTLYVHAGGYQREQPFYVEKDWTAASYWYEMVALSDDVDARVVLPGLTRESLQGDSRVVEFFNSLGVHTSFVDGGAVLTKQALPAGSFIHLNLSEQPDLAQTLVVTCAMKGIPFHFEGLQSLRIKETDRLSALQAELVKLGVRVQVRLDSEMLWDGHVDAVSIDNMAIDTYEDHRMAMAFAPCAMKFPGLRINHPEVVSKSYPSFWTMLQPFLKQD